MSPYFPLIVVLLNTLLPWVAQEGRAQNQTPLTATLNDGSAVQGHLTASSRRIAIVNHDGRNIPLSSVQSLSFVGKNRLSGLSAKYVIHLWNNEQIPGIVTSVDKDFVIVQFEQQVLAIPRTLVRSIEHAQEEVAIHEFDFESVPDSTVIEGAHRVKTQSQSGSQSLQLWRPGDSFMLELDAPPPHGRLEFDFRDQLTRSSDHEVVCECVFQQNARTRRLNLILSSSAESYGVLTPDGPAVAVQPIGREEMWRHFQILFDSEKFRVLVDRSILADSRTPIGHLRSIRIIVRPTSLLKKIDPPRAPLGYLDNVIIRRSATQQDSWQPDSDQDDLRLLVGDQLFGFIEASNKSVSISNSFGSTSFPWSDVHAAHLKPTQANNQLAGTVFHGQLFHIWLKSPESTLEMEAILEDVKPEHWVLSHPYVGTWEIPTQVISRAEPRGNGRWLSIDPTFHHFGDNFIPDMLRPYPEGSIAQWQFELETNASDATLELVVSELESMDPSAPFFEDLKQGHLRTHLNLNGKQITPEGLNGLVRMTTNKPVRISITIPQAMLKVGTNILSLDQTSQRSNPDSYDDFGLSNLRLFWDESTN